MRRLAAAILGLTLAPSLALSNPRTTILVPLSDAPSWRDMAFLAATPAAEQANVGGGSLIALDERETFGPEIRDYIRRYKPTSVVLLDDDGVANLPTAFQALKVGSAEESSLQLSRQFWKSSKSAVICSADDFESALIAAPLAALLRAPLFYGFSEATRTQLKRLGVTQLVTFGLKTPKFKGSVTTLSGATQTMEWAKKRGLKVSYLAAVNPLDRKNFSVRKLSILGAQLAAGRQGLVAPLRFQVEWKRAFDSSVLTGALPPGVPKSAAPAKSGVLAVGATQAQFVLTGSPKEENLRLSIDADGDGTYAAPVASGDVVELAGKRWSVSLGTRTKFGKTDVHLTWPTVDVLTAQLETYYRALGATPKHLCLVGFPDSVPHAILGRGGIVEEHVSDLPFSMPEGAKFAEIGVGRVIAENVSFGSLYAARALTYTELLSPDWAKASSQAEWENSFGPIFENAGFSSPYYLSGESIPWVKEGQRAPSFGQESPAANSAILAHSEHSWWRSLGSMFTSEAEVLMAPTVVESGGCGTACLDREADNRSVVARLLRVGAVSFAGGSRELSAESSVMRTEFWNGVLAGDTIGQAHRRAQNSGLITVHDLNEGPGGAYRYSTAVRMQFGDPAIALRIPGKPRTAPARTTIQGDRVSVFAPETWATVKIVVPPDWKQWAGKDLFSVRGAGAYVMTSWGSAGHDVERVMVNAEFKTTKPVVAIEPISKPSAPLGWRGKWHSVANADGSFTHRFAVQMIDFDQQRGQILSSVPRLDFRVKY